METSYNTTHYTPPWKTIILQELHNFTLFQTQLTYYITDEAEKDKVYSTNGRHKNAWKKMAGGPEGKRLERPRRI